MSTDITSNIFTNTTKLIKGNTARARFLNLLDSAINTISDLNVANGYLGIDTNGRVNISFINAASQTGKYLRDDGTWQSVVISTPNLSAVLAVGNTSGAFNILFNNNHGIDSANNGDTLNIGPTNAGIINYGNSTTTHNFLGTAVYELQVNSYVQDKAMTLNYGGGASSAIGVGFEIEEGGTIKGFFKTNSTRSGFSFSVPGTSFVADLNLNLLSANRAYSLPDVAGTIALINGGQTFTSAIWNGTAIAGSFLVNSGVTGQLITGFTSGPGTVSATDSILQAIQKIDANTNNLSEGYDLSLQAAHLYLTNR